MKLQKQDKILFLPAWYPSKVNLLSGIAIQRFAELTSKNYQVIVLYVFGNDELKNNYEICHTEENGVNVFRLSYKRENLNQKAGLINKLAYLYWFIFLTIKGIKLIHQKYGKPKLVHTHVLTRNGVVAYLYKLWFGIDYCITERWSRYFVEDGSYKGFFRKKITQFVVKKSSGISTVSKALKKAMQLHGLNHSVFKTIPNTVNFDVFKFKPAFKIISEKKRFIHVSCFNDRDKNISGIIKACHQLDLKGYTFDLQLIGDGIDKSKLVDLVNSLSWKNVNITFEGQKHSVQLASYYQHADALIVFSNYETFCIVVAEAHCCGLPVIATNVGALPELVNPKNGILIAPKDETALAGTMQQFLLAKVNFNKAEIAVSAETVYNESAIRNSIETFYYHLN